MVMRGDRVLKIEGSAVIEGIALGLVVNLQGEVRVVCQQLLSCDQSSSTEYFIALPAGLKTKEIVLVPSRA